MSLSTPAGSETRRATRGLKGAFSAVIGFSAVINVLMLSGSLFMMEVYDRVLPSRSLSTLAGLFIIVVFLYAVQGILELVRGRILVRIGTRLDEELAARACDVDMRLSIERPAVARYNDPHRDLEAIRSFLAGSGPGALCDLPWAPFFLAICFVFHPLLGTVALGGGAILLALTLATEAKTRATVRRASEAGFARARQVATMRRTAEVIDAMGMARPLSARLQETGRKLLRDQTKAGDIAGGFGAAGRTVRMILQSAVLAVGAYLVVRQEVTAGVMIAASIISARALAPVDQLIANWKGFVSARQSRRRLDALLASMPPRVQRMALPAPSSSLVVEGMTVAAPENGRVLVSAVSFSVSAGSAVAVIGPSASGKSSLARALVGVWPAAAGAIRLDGASLDQWPRDSLGRHIGYLPQEVDLIDGTIAENIGRFEPAARPEDVVAAARAAGVHDMIVSLPEGYATRVEGQGTSLSAGQRQRVALARALYGDPFLVVLDEPNSNLDADGEEALKLAILGIRQRGAIAVIVAHRPSALAGVDLVLTLAGGRMQAFGLKEEVLKAVLQQDQGLRRRINRVGGFTS
jgi:PrtD family type I secretion system ABC transporter